MTFVVLSGFWLFSWVWGLNEPIKKKNVKQQVKNKKEFVGCILKIFIKGTIKT